MPSPSAKIQAPVLLAALALLLAMAAAPAGAADCTWTKPALVLAACQDQCRNTLTGKQADACATDCGKAVERYKSWAAKPCTFMDQSSCSADMDQRGDAAGITGDIAYGIIAKKGCMGEAID